MGYPGHIPGIFFLKIYPIDIPRKFQNLEVVLGVGFSDGPGATPKGLKRFTGWPLLSGFGSARNTANVYISKSPDSTGVSVGLVHDFIDIHSDFGLWRKDKRLSKFGSRGRPSRHDQPKIKKTKFEAGFDLEACLESQLFAVAVP